MITFLALAALIGILVIFLLHFAIGRNEATHRLTTVTNMWEDVSRRLSRAAKELEKKNTQVKALKAKLAKYQARELEDKARKAEYAKEQQRPPRRLVRLPKPQETK